MMLAQERPSWTRDGRDWPNREASVFVEAGGLAWHVQVMGQGPTLLLLHGTGASTHSWRDLAPRLAGHFRVVAPDLPGHGFTAMPGSRGLSLDGMSALVAALLRQLGVVPDFAVGHSAGAAILIAMALDGGARPKAIVSLNGALSPIPGSGLFSPLAKLMFLNPLTPRLFAWRAGSPDAVRRLLVGTGSQLDRQGIELYQRLFRFPGHVAGALGMMANWDLVPLRRRLPRLDTALVLVAAAGDRAVPPAVAEAVAGKTPLARLVRLAEGGHLVHEESPDTIADLILAEAHRIGLPA